MNVWTEAMAELFNNEKALGCILAEYQQRAPATPRARRCQEEGEPALRRPAVDGKAQRDQTQRLAGRAGLRAEPRSEMLELHCLSSRWSIRQCGSISVLLKDSGMIHRFIYA